MSYWNIGTWLSIPPDIKMQFSDQVKIKLISQLNNDIS